LGTATIGTNSTASLQGTAILNGTTGVTISTAELKANDVIYLTRATKGTSPGYIYYDSSTSGSLIIYSTDASDDGTVNWEIIH
jgi:hypothetical protein